MCCIGGSCAWKCCKAIIGLGFSAGLLVLIYWAIFQPRHIRATVSSAAFSNLTVVSSTSSSAVISYTLAVNLSLYNPSVRADIYYDAIDARLRFRDAVLGAAARATSPSEFLQRRKTGHVVAMEFGGTGGVGVDRDVAGELEREAQRGEAVGLELDVDVRVRYVFRILKLRQRPRVRCWLSVPVRAEGQQGGGGAVGGVIDSGDRCSVKY